MHLLKLFLGQFSEKAFRKISWLIYCHNLLRQKSHSCRWNLHKILALMQNYSLLGLNILSYLLFWKDIFHLYLFHNNFVHFNMLLDGFSQMTIDQVLYYYHLKGLGSTRSLSSQKKCFILFSIRLERYCQTDKISQGPLLCTFPITLSWIPTHHLR